MSYIKVWIHAVWTTKNKKPVLFQDKRNIIFDHIIENGKEKSLFIDTVNGHKDHVHCLFRLRNDMTIMKTIQLIKGESSFWANKNKILNEKLYWQKEYFAVSLSESAVERVRKYINNQTEHHRKKSWQQELDEFIRKYEFNDFNG
jgi:REP element-mobilizing transposase RayT